MKLSENQELKKAILKLPQKEKDKLLLRLIAKDKILTERLHFVLFEDETRLIERTNAIEEGVKLGIGELKKNRYKKAREILNFYRKSIKLVNHHFKVTKAKYEEVQLRLLLLNDVIDLFYFLENREINDDERVLFKIVYNGIRLTVNKYYKLHEDLQYDLSTQLQELLGKIDKHSVKEWVFQFGLTKI